MQLKKFSKAAQDVLLKCQASAKKNHNPFVEPEHLALALMDAPEIKDLVSKKKLNGKELEQSLLKLISSLPVVTGNELRFSGRLIQALVSAEALSIKKQHENIFVADLLLSLLENKDKYASLGALLAEYFLGAEKVHENEQALSLSPDLEAYVDRIQERLKNKDFDPLFAREKECVRLTQILSRKNRNNPLLIGEPGVGRSSIVLLLAQAISERKVASHLIGKEILELNLSAIIAGTTLRGQFEERMRSIIKEISKRPGQFILFIRDLSAVIGAGGEGASDAANLLIPALLKGDLQIIGLVSPTAFKKRIENNSSFERFFQPMWINQPDKKECDEILFGLKPKFELFHGVFIQDEALSAAIELGSKHLSGRVLPELALDVLDEACSHHRIALEKKPEAITSLESQIAALELELQSSKNKKNSAQEKNKKALLLRLQEKVNKLSECYEQEISFIESIRALKRQLYDINKEIERKKASKDFAAVIDLEENTKILLEKEINNNNNALIKIQKNNGLIDPWVKRDDIAAIISQETGIPVQKMIQSEREKLASMESQLSKKVIGQNEAIKAVSSAIRRARVGLKDPKRPIGSFLFLGPTGVGKTELARTLTSFLFDDERAMLRFDMSEFMERHSVARLIGAPPGYQGAEEGGQLTETVKRKPYSVVLFDEIEKAHVDVLNILLQVLDEGRLTDSKGNLVLFANTVIVLTSNVGADILLQMAHSEAEKADVKAQVMERLSEYLRPEFINRLDEIVIFDPISEAGIAEIAELMLAQLKSRLNNEGFSFEINYDVKKLILKEGFNPQYGARPLKRAIQRLIENPLALLLVENVFLAGDTIRAELGSQSEVSFIKIN
jgi:ATP-dependent Clp protease ATP-binding subunit ClpB